MYDKVDAALALSPAHKGTTSGDFRRYILTPGTTRDMLRKGFTIDVYLYMYN